MSQQINLYNPLFLKQEKHFSARTMVQGLSVIALGLAALYAYALFESRAATRHAQQYRDQLSTQRDQMLKLSVQIAAQGRSKALESEVARLEGELKTRRATLQLLGTGELGNTTGFSEFFAAFGRQAMPGVWLTGFTISDSGNDLLINGRALRPELIPSYLGALNKEDMMRGRRLTEMKLAAREAPKAGDPAAKGVALPERYVEFILNAPLRAPALAKKP